MSDKRPQGCRFRLKDEGKPYPKSSCQSCGKTIATGLGASCPYDPEMEISDWQVGFDVGYKRGLDEAAEIFRVCEKLHKWAGWATEGEYNTVSETPFQEVEEALGNFRAQIQENDDAAP